MLTADEVLAVVRVHADRVHDAVRRLGCGPDAAVRVVRTSALELVDAVARRPDEVRDPVGWWFARARALARQAATEDDALPLGGGVLSTDADQVRLAEALESRPERERAALLLRDSYDLPATTVGTVLGLDPEAATEMTARARIALLPALTAVPPLPTSDHVQPLAGLARLAEGGTAAAREGGTRRHAQACEACGAVLDAQERARRLLAGLTVVALPDAAREALIASAEERARALLPASPPAAEEEWDEPQRRYSLSLMALGLVLAVAAGAGIGAVLSRGGPAVALGRQGELPLITAAPVLTVAPRSPSPTPRESPSPRVFLVTPSPTPTPSVTATPTPTESETAAPAEVVLDPTSGPRDTLITVTGQGFDPLTEVVVQFRDTLTGQVGATTSTTTDAEGTFTTQIAAHDDRTNPFPAHTVSADDGTHRAEASFTVTS